MWKFIDITLVGLIILITAIISFKRIKKTFHNKEIQDSTCCGCSNKSCPYKIQGSSDCYKKSEFP